MEVHAHSHTERKKFTHYLWEFLMLFLAVFCGFLAEYQLEHIIEKKTEKEYITSMIEDLKTDTANLESVIRQFHNRIIKTDTALALLPAMARGYNDTLWRNLPHGFPDFIKSDRTLQQLKNSGGLRLIKNLKAATGITEYDLKYRDLDLDVASLSNAFINYQSMELELIDYASLDPDRKRMTPQQMEASGRNYLLKTDKPLLGNFYNDIRVFKILCFVVKKQEERLLEKAAALIQLLQKEYHLK